MRFGDFYKLYTENLNDDYSPKIELVSNEEGRRGLSRLCARRKDW